MKYPDMKQDYPDFTDYRLILTEWLRTLNKGLDPVYIYYQMIGWDRHGS